MPSWLVWSIVLSVVLTVVLNVALRLFPSAGRRADDGLGRLAGRRSGTSVYVPWKLMLVGSIVLTILLNVLLMFGRST